MNTCCESFLKENGNLRRFSTPGVPTHCLQCCVWVRRHSASCRRSSFDCGHAVRRQLSLVEFPTQPPSLERWRLQVAEHTASGQDRSDASTEIDTSELSAVSSETACRAAELVSGSYQLLPNGSIAERPSFCQYFFSPRLVWRSLLLGQVLSLLTAISAGVDNRCVYTSTRTAFSFFGLRIVAHYVLLCVVLVVWAVIRPSRSGVAPAIRHKCWCYLLLALTDVEARYLSLITAYYTSISGVQLFNSAAVPAAMAISCKALDVNYKPVHLFGTLLCLVGLACHAWANFEDVTGLDSTLGIVFGLAGAMLRSVVAVTEEYAVKVWSWTELLGMLGLFGTVFSALQLWLFLGLAGTEKGLLVEGVQVASLTAAQCLSVAVLRDSGAVAMLLSLFTANMYLPFTSLVMCQLVCFTGTTPVQMLYEMKMDVRHYISLFLMLSGLLVYSVRRTPILCEQPDAYSIMGDSSSETSTVKDTCEERTPLRKEWSKR